MTKLDENSLNDAVLNPTAGVSIADLLEADTTEFVLVEATDTTPPVVIKGYTKASKQWTAAKAKYQVDTTIEVTKKQSALVDTDMTTAKKKALASLVTSIEGLKEGTMTATKDIAELFTDPRARIIVTKWNTHLDELGNELLD